MGYHLGMAGHPGDEATGHTVCKEADANLEDDWSHRYW